jgi:class 3 adenylate cyclase
VIWRCGGDDMTFRAQIVLAIVGVVVLTLMASLVIVQRQNAETFGGAIDALLRLEATSFQREQETRHRNAAEDVARLAQSVRIFAALEAGDPGVYHIARDELRTGEFDFFRLLDAAGRMIAPPRDGRAGRLDPDTVHGRLAPSKAARDRVELGFVEVRDGDASMPFRVLSAPIENFDRRVGTLILGQRIRLGGGAAQAATELRSALWLDGRLVGGDVPDDLRDALAKAVLRAPRPVDARLEIEDRAYRLQRFPLNDGSAYPRAELVSVVPLAQFESEQRQIALRIGAVGAVAAALAALLATLLSRQLARPIADLVHATRVIRRGDYRPPLPRSSTREMHALSHAFGEMAEGLAQRDRYHSLLQQVADPQVAAELVAGRIRLGGELREVTVMFCDIRGYTPLTVGRAPETVIEILNAHLGAMTRIVQAHGGVINQFAGDSVMALFGAPHSYGDDAERAVRCACAMIRARAALNAATDPPIEVGIGIATGNVVAGCIGGENRSDYTVVGERVNLAARLTSAAAPGEIVVDEHTSARLGERVAMQPLAPLALKGFAAPVQAWRIDAAQAVLP